MKTFHIINEISFPFGLVELTKSVLFGIGCFLETASNDIDKMYIHQELFENQLIFSFYFSNLC